MIGRVHTYPILIKEIYLDFYGHVNNATYLILFEEARWDFITQNGYGYDKIKETGLGPVILDITVRFLKELVLREEIIIHTYMTAYDRKIGKLVQKMIRGSDECCVAEYTIGLFHLKDRKLVNPTPAWLQAIGVPLRSESP